MYDILFQAVLLSTTAAEKNSGEGNEGRIEKERLYMFTLL